MLAITSIFISDSSYVNLLGSLGVHGATTRPEGGEDINTTLQSFRSAGEPLEVEA